MSLALDSWREHRPALAEVMKSEDRLSVSEAFNWGETQKRKLMSGRGLVSARHTLDDALGTVEEGITVLTQLAETDETRFARLRAAMAARRSKRRDVGKAIAPAAVRVKRATTSTVTSEDE